MKYWPDINAKPPIEHNHSLIEAGASGAISGVIGRYSGRQENAQVCGAGWKPIGYRGSIPRRRPPAPGTLIRGPSSTLPSGGTYWTWIITSSPTGIIRVSKRCSRLVRKSPAVVLSSLHDRSQGTQTALDALPVPRGAGSEPRYFFWNETTSRRAVVGIAERTLAAVFKKSKVPSAHAHRFRHTLATRLLGMGGTEQEVRISWVTVLRLCGSTTRSGHRRDSNASMI